MPKKTTKPAPVAITGYVRPLIYREFTYDEYPNLPEGAEPLTVKVPVNLSFDQLDAIPYSTGTAYADLWQVIAPYVVEWNVIRTALETGQPEPVPPPAEAGWEVFRVLDHIEANWVADKVKFGYLAQVEDAKAAADKMRQLIADAKGRASRQSERTGERPNANGAETGE